MRIDDAAWARGIDTLPVERRSAVAAQGRRRGTVASARPGHLHHRPYRPRTRALRPMHAYVYKSQRKADTYLYLAERDGFDRVPDALRQQLGTLRFVLEVALTPERRLAQADPDLVRANLGKYGFYVQRPPGVADPMSSDWGTDA